MHERATAVSRALVDHLRLRAKALGVTQSELAVRTGVSQSQISRVLRHEVTLMYYTAVAICAALDTTVPEAHVAAELRLSR